MILKLLTLKALYKSAIRSGKIIFIGRRNQHVEYNFGNSLRKLDDNEWNLFEDAELQFRKRISSKKVNYGDFICKGDPVLWIKLIKYLSAIFYDNKVFSHFKKNNQRWSVPFIKYFCRISRTFPIGGVANELVDKSSIEFLEKQLYFINNTIRNFFTLKCRINVNDCQVVSRDKLTNLWINSRKKAIAIIKNNGNWPVHNNVPITVNQNENYYKSSNKYIAESDVENVVNVVNVNLLNRNDYSLIDASDYFTYDEIMN